MTRGLSARSAGSPRRLTGDDCGYRPRMSTLMFVAAVILAIFGIIALLDGAIILGIILLVAAIAVGPGGYQIGRRDRV